MTGSKEITSNVETSTAKTVQTPKNQTSEKAGRKWTNGEKALLGLGILFTVAGVVAIAMSAYTLSGEAISIPGIGEVMNSEAAGYTLGAGLASFATGVALFVKLRKDRARLTVENKAPQPKPTAEKKPLEDGEQSAGWYKNERPVLRSRRTVASGKRSSQRKYASQVKKGAVKGTKRKSYSPQMQHVAVATKR